MAVMDKVQILEQIREARRIFLRTLEGLPEDVLMRPFVVGFWSIKDVLAHLTVWQSELITALANLNPHRTPHIVEIEDIDEWNETQYHSSVRRPVEIVLEDFHNVHKQLLKSVEALDEATLTDGRLFPWMEGEPLWYLCLLYTSPSPRD